MFALQDPERPGLIDTPGRVSRALREALSGYAMSGADAVGGAVFKELRGGGGGGGGDGEEETGGGGGAPSPPVVAVRGMHFSATDAATLLPFQGTASIAYVPQGGRVLGLSKAARLVDAFARRLTTPAALAADVLAALRAALGLDEDAAAVCVRANAPGEARLIDDFATGGGSELVAAEVITGDPGLADMFAGAGADNGSVGSNAGGLRRGALEQGRWGAVGNGGETVESCDVLATDEALADDLAAMVLASAGPPLEVVVAPDLAAENCAPPLRAAARRYISALAARTAGQRRGHSDPKTVPGSTPENDCALMPAQTWAPPLPVGARWHAHVALDLHSTCEHHLLPFSGYAHVGCMLGADSSESERPIPRGEAQALVTHVAARLQVQERITEQVADAMYGLLCGSGGGNSAGVIVVLEAAHMCMAVRGVRQPRAATLSVAARGALDRGPAPAAAIVGALVRGR